MLFRSDPAVTLRILGQILLVIVLGEIERACGRDLAGDLAVPLLAQLAAAEASKAAYQAELSRQGYGQITSEIAPAGSFYFAEDYHQQYLAKNPQGYCGIGGTGVACPIGVGVTA